MKKEKKNGNHDQNDLTPKQAKYLAGIVEGKTKKDAALAAGYAPSSALSVRQAVEKPNVRVAFAELIRATISQEKIAQRINEGLDAMETKFFQYEGIVTDTRDVINWAERRQYAQLAAEFGDLVVPKRPAEAGSGVNILINFPRDPMVDEVVIPEKPSEQA